jgi:hypothetical protein
MTKNTLMGFTATFSPVSKSPVSKEEEGRVTFYY